MAEHVPIDSPLARSTAVTTTETRPFVADVPSTSALTIVYSASRGSKIEPCGCRSLNLGGIDREAAMLDALRKANTGSIYLDAGGFFREFTDESLKLQGYYVLDALRQAKVDAINVGYHDIRQGLGNLVKLRDQLHLPFISANIVNASSKAPVFEPFRILTVTRRGSEKPLRIGVVGVTARNYVAENEPLPTQRLPLSESMIEPDETHTAAGTSNLLRARWTIAGYPAGGGDQPSTGGGSSPALEYARESSTSTLSTPYEILNEADALQLVVPDLRTKCDIVVLLSFTTRDRTRQLVEAVPGIDVAIAGQYMRNYDPVRVGPSSTLLVTTDHDGKYLGQADLQLDGTNHLVNATARLHPILLSIQPDPAFTPFLAAYTRESANMSGVQQQQQLSEKTYAGATSCRTCHAEAFTQWKAHDHSRAMKSLVDKGMQYNNDCLRCHTLAFKQPGGFSDLRVTPGLANVQCEVCHGPGQKHVEEQQKLAQAGGTPAKGTAQLLMKWDQQFCIQCHDAQNDPRFNFEEDLKRVRHKNPAPPRAPQTTGTVTM